MSTTICNMISKIKNACMAGKDYVNVQASKASLAVLKVMKDDGYILNYEVQDRIIQITLKYYNGRSVIRYIRSISTGRKPVYVTLKEVEKLAKKFSTSIISTNLGVLAHQEAISNKIGGKLICEVSA